MKLYCEQCGRRIYLKGDDLVVYSEGIILCSDECVKNHYDINWVTKEYLSEIFADD